MKRYDPIEYNWSGGKMSGQMEEYADGDFVRFDEYAAVKAENANLLDALKESVLVKECRIIAEQALEIKALKAERDQLLASVARYEEMTNRHIISVVDAAHDANAGLIKERDELWSALKIAVTQNECDMLMTGEELRKAREALAKKGGAS